MLSKSVTCIATVLLVTTASFLNAQRIETYGECRTPNAEPGSCIRLQDCTFLYNLLKRNSNENREFLRRSQCGTYNRTVLICCNKKHIPVQQSPTNSGRLLPEPGVCGNILSNRIYGGNISQIDDFPWMAQILYKEGNQVHHRCGGSLINDRYVLTAAHCVGSSSRPFAVRLGEWDTLTNPDCEMGTRGSKNCADPHVDIGIEKTITYPNAGRNQMHDIALLRLSRRVNYTFFIKPICLPISDNLKDISFDGVAMDIAGWGFTEKGTKSNLKMMAVVRGVPAGSCRQMYGSRRHKIELANSQICAGGERGVDSCRGDSGGALVASENPDNSRAYYYIAGIISFGLMQCGTEGWPSVYTKVSSYVDWIQQNIQP